MNLTQILHLRIWDATDAYERSIYRNRNSRSPEERKRILKHQQIWTRLYGRQLGWRVCAAVFALGADIGVHGGNHWLVAFFSICAGGFFVESARFIANNRRTATPEELRNLAPSLDLSAAERTYLGAMLALFEINSLSEGSKGQIAAQLNELLSCHYAAEEQREVLVSSLGESTTEQQLLEDRLLVMKQLASSTDDATRTALQQTVVAFDQRIENRRSLAPHVERLSAQIQMIDQTLSSVSESLSALRLAPSTAAPVDTRSIANMLTDLNRQSKSITAAVEEVMTIGQRS